MASLASEEEFRKRLLSTFKIEAQEHLNSLVDGLAEIERKGLQGDHSTVIDRMFRNAHSLKGSARTVNMLSVEEVCQEIEGIFYDIKKGRLYLTAQLIDILHRSCAAVKSLINKPEQSPPQGHKAVVSLLKNFRQDNLYSTEAIGDAQLKRAKQSDMVLKHEPEDILTHEAHDPSQTGILKIESLKLEGLLNQIEEMVQLKGFMNSNIAELLRLNGLVSEMLKDAKAVAFNNDMGEHNSNRQSYADYTGNILTPHLNRLRAVLDGLNAHIRRCKNDKNLFNSRLDDILFELRGIIMIPLSNITEAFPRMIRDIARNQGKSVELLIEGGDTKIDRRILEELKDPLVHIIRNSIDHGIEPADERVRCGKQKGGIIKIHAFQERGNEIVLRVMDDGRGIDIKKVKEKALKLRLIDEERLSRLSDQEAMQFVFKPEFSTAEIVTTISGRGLGLSIAREAADRLGGSLTAASEPDKGTMFVFKLPINISTIDIIIIKSFEGILYGMPTRSVSSVLRVEEDEIKTVEGRETIEFKGSALSVIDIDDALDIAVNTEKKPLRRMLLIINHDNRNIAFSVKEILHEEQVFLKGLGRQLARVRNISGAATISSGMTILVINPHDLMRSALNKGAVSSFQNETITFSRNKKNILIAEDSITARTLFKSILEGAGFSVATAVDGLDALTALRSGEYDLLVSDVQMPRMNGFELTEKIRNDRRLFRLPVVLITGLETKEDKERGIEAGANAYIVKSSFDQSDLLEVIKRLI